MIKRTRLVISNSFFVVPHFFVWSELPWWYYILSSSCRHIGLYIDERKLPSGTLCPRLRSPWKIKPVTAYSTKPEKSHQKIRNRKQTRSLIPCEQRPFEWPMLAGYILKTRLHFHILRAHFKGTGRFSLCWPKYTPALVKKFHPFYNAWALVEWYLQKAAIRVGESRPENQFATCSYLSIVCQLTMPSNLRKLIVMSQIETKNQIN